MKAWMDLGNGVHLEIVRKFCYRYLGNMLNGGGGANSASVARVLACDMCEECDGVWK